ncbi:hypothetical protein BpHYR1_013783 [Brachionus plicatilis]|uniref:Uncharacterized protein n=1 Tax=Brachionus plicatilis TaxID=10195 RepID=A0A3M7RAY4_BRAPC|nr:hypothetical protein BpHYR1_013783 [Brachionus plicatilis]
MSDFGLIVFESGIECVVLIQPFLCVYIVKKLTQSLIIHLKICFADNLMMLTNLYPEFFYVKK